MDLLAWGNVRPEKNNRYWVHLVLAVGVVVYTCYVFFDELRGYIRLRQSYLTSPQHRLRASATTVLVTAIPRKWCTHEALDGLYDVFPGGIRNIWINRNFDELNEKVKLRNKLATKLESAMTDLIRNAKKAHLNSLKKDAKKGPKSEAMEKAAERATSADQNGKDLAMRGGISAGDPHQTRHTLDEALDEPSNPSPDENSRERHQNRFIPVPIVGPGIEAVGHGIDNLGKTVFRGLKQVGKDVDDRLMTQGGFVPDDSEEIPRRNQSPDGIHLSIPPSVTVDQEYQHHARNNAPVHHPDGPDGLWPYETTPETEYSPQSPYKTSFDSKMDGAVEKSGHAPSKKPQNVMSQVKSWKQSRKVPFGIPSPTPHGYEEDEFPLSSRGPVKLEEKHHPKVNEKGGNASTPVKKGKLPIWIPFLGSSSKETRESEEYTYPEAYDKRYNPNDGEPLWKEYLKEKDRDSIRLPIFGWQWMPSLPLMGQKVDTIDYCRRELARLNVEIEQDQKEPKKFPLMNSAFIQFNHQVAAHMACQSVSHHTPQQMTPRIVEISPDDVIWDNMSVKWWEKYVRTAAVVMVIAALVLGWAVPVAFTGILGNVDSISRQYSWLHWVQRLPGPVLGLVSGVLPQILLAGVLALLPVILRFLAKSEGIHTGMAVELSVQNYYFAFLFVQVFLVVSISSGFTNTITQLSKNPANVPGILAQNLPRSTNYFFSYMVLQALSVSAGALVQLPGLLKWFILAPIVDRTGRQKWKRQTSLSVINWGTFFPVYTNLAAIGEYHDHSPIAVSKNCGILNRFRIDLLRYFTADYGLQHHNIQSLLACVPLQHALCHPISL